MSIYNKVCDTKCFLLLAYTYVLPFSDTKTSLYKRMLKLFVTMKNTISQASKGYLRQELSEIIYSFEAWNRSIT